MIRKLWDKIGICASSLCLLHCLATPFLLLLFPGIKASLDGHGDFYIHEIFAVIVIGSILIAVYPHCKKHGHKDIIALAIIGIALVLTPIFMHEAVSSIEDWITGAGSLFLIAAHLKNMKIRHGKCSTQGTCSTH